MSYEYSRDERPTLIRQYQLACYMLLATVIATVADIILLLAGADIFIPYCAALPYYLTFLGHYFDGYTISTYTATGMALAFVCLAIWMLIWWKSKKHPGWLKFGMVLVILDTLMLAIVAFVFIEDPASCLFEGILHIAVIYEIYVGCRSRKRLDLLAQQAAAPITVPFDAQTPADTEYSDDLNE